MTPPLFSAFRLPRSSKDWTKGRVHKPSLKAELASPALKEDFPRLRLGLLGPQDWRDYHSLRLRLRIDSADAAVGGRNLNFVFYDRNTRLENVPGNPAKQQGIHLSAEANRWIETELPLESIRRSAIESLEIYLYSNPPTAEHRGCGYLQIDETPIRYLEPGRGKACLGYLWASNIPGGSVLYRGTRAGTKGH